MKKGLSRRNLFKYMAVSGATVATASCEQKPEKLIPLLVGPDNIDYVPHDSYHYMTTCRECSAGCGMMVTAREGRAQKAEGNPNHPLNQGALCAKGHSSMQALYNPERLASALDSSQNAISWEEAIKTFQEQITAAKGSVVYLGKPAQGSDGVFFDRWLQGVGGGRRIEFEVFNRASLRKANQISFNRSDIPRYAIERARLLVNFSADFMENWGNQVDNTRRFTKMHAYNERTKTKNKFVHISPHVSLTGSSSDEWFKINPGTEGLIALAMASEIRKTRRNYPELQTLLNKYTPEKVAAETGVKADRIKQLAREFWTRRPSLALVGGNLVAGENATATHVAVNILNAVAGNLGQTVQFPPEENTNIHAHQDVLQLIEDLNQDKVKVVIIDEVNPVFAMPKTAGLEAALRKAFVVSLSAVRNETTKVSNLTLATRTPYETWGDSFPYPGIRNIQQPVMVPVKFFDARAKEDLLLEVNRNIGGGFLTHFKTYKDYLQSIWQGFQREAGHTGSFQEFWIDVLQNGGMFRERPPIRVDINPRVTRVDFKPAALEGNGKFTLLPVSSLMMGDGSGANKPWLQEVPDPISQMVWGSWLEINPKTAREMGIQDRDRVEVSTPYGKLKLTAFYQFGIHPEAIAIPFGQGHTASGKAADNYGVNVLDLLPNKVDGNSGELAWLSVKADVKRINEKSYDVNLDGNARQLGRSIAGSVTLADLKKGKSSYHAWHRPEETVEFYPDRSETAGYYKPYRWGMTIDLDRCNGCSACVVACYAENNIPVVGKERAALGREMSWIRLERYIEGYEDEFQVHFAPVGCQHCGNAGCETVCPVYATYHNPEGLNSMVYNRCVGTRYCSNNCMYKVRRFNWFDYEFPAPLHEQLNSTITTRSVGVMEKCTFCVHRIKEAQDQAKELERDLRDGEVVTACQQTCPTQAITFGNLMDKNSKVSQLSKRADDELETRDRQYEMMPEVNYKPAITYLKRVTFHDVSGHGDDKHHDKKTHGHKKDDHAGLDNSKIKQEA